ncbi:carcinoembryonic antigen-related cell adhesion molecule 1-like [Haliotis asinina]|uniref:carcinoembryonic antigen-related cell adhesion molecule 1-like n=1 Tax=Haliotis asinina TaxID=109174 RepID=UPI0035320936
MSVAHILFWGLHVCVIFVLSAASMTTEYPYTVTRVGEDVNITLNPANVSFLYFVWVNGSVAEKLLLVKQMSPHVVVLNSSHTGYKNRITYTGEDSPSQTGQMRFTIYNVTVQDAGTYCCQGSNGQEVTGCRQVLVVAQKPATPTITRPTSPVSGENVTLTCSSSSRSLPPDDNSLVMAYIWRRDRTLLESGDESPTGGDDLTITHVSRENQGDTYRCQAVEEGLESDWSHEHVLDVLYGPDQVHFEGARDKLEVEEGKPVTVRCSADCNPACTVTWWDTSRQVVVTGHREAVLYIPAVDVSVSGQYTCHVNNSHGSSSRNLTLEVFFREVSESGVVSIVPVTAVCSVLIVVIVVVVIVVVCRKHRRGASEGDANVDDIVPIVAVYSIMLTVVAVVVAAVTVLVCKDAKENQDNRCGEYLTVMAERLSRDFSDVPRTSNNAVLPLYDYERLLRDQFHTYTSLHPSSSSTNDLGTRGPRYQVKPKLTVQFHIYTSFHPSSFSTEDHSTRGPQYQVKPKLTVQFHIYTSFHPSSSSTEDHSTR